MSPDQAANLLAELEKETSDEILHEMEDTEEKEDVQDLLEYDDDCAGGMMNTEYVSLLGTATVGDAIAALRDNEELIETLNTLFLVDEHERLLGVVPVARLFNVHDSAPLMKLKCDVTIKVSVDERQDRVTETFDKYNLLALPVLNDDGHLVGVITADDIITVLRNQ